MASPAQPASPSRTGVAERLLALLAAFDADHRELTLAALARRADLPAATAHRLVGQLTSWGALEPSEQGRYRIGLRLWEVACLAPRSSGLRRAVLPFLEDLYETTHENVQLAVRDGVDTLYVELISGRSAVVVRTTVGSRWPLHATGVGLVLLAYAPAPVQQQVCAAPLARFTAHTIADPARLRATLAEVRRADAAVSDRQITDDAVSVAAPIRDASGAVVAALSLVVPATANPAPLIPAVRMAARGSSRALGYGVFHSVEGPLAEQG
ncbi:IclR family transcriptional regulator [Actinospica robiniae]|uniref:IclR family transcriptional regulator n=1 Tax=Actinospica robiniae TaxID=304901 RepID=UPI0004231B86|nr:IclR family transcriptional regulator [Actinospica robiniae]